jgi:Protein of unknown function (DUF3288)
MAQLPNPKDTGKKDQEHPQSSSDRQVSARLLQEEATDYNLAELARLRVRYDGFPGARDIQANLEQALKRWQLSEAELFAKTRNIHAQIPIYKVKSNKREDWN